MNAHKEPDGTVNKNDISLRKAFINGKHGRTEKDTSSSASAAAEDTAGKAVVWMPEVVKAKALIGVLLHLHDFGVGKREQTKSSGDHAGCPQNG